jgi:hypothetical protein
MRHQLGRSEGIEPLGSRGLESLLKRVDNVLFVMLNHDEL